jgi:hypothetical protein
MSDHSHEITALEPEKFDLKHVGGWPKMLLTAGVVGIVISLIGFLIGLGAPAWKDQFAFSWLFAFMYFFTICCGGLFWTSLHHATDAEWSTLVRRQTENIAKLLPVFFIFFLPLILFCAPSLWKWWNMNPGEDVIRDAKHGYLNQGFFWIRYLAYFLFLSWVSITLYKSSTAQDADGASKHTFTMRKFGIGGIVVVGLTITFTAFDWVMGLDYKWFSTMWGVYTFAGAAGSSMSLLVLLVTFLKSKGYLKAVNTEHYHIMGKFMLAFTIFWAYIGYSQYMLIWYANIPEETIYFRIRNTDSWWYLSQFLVIGRFFIPFPLLLLQFTKKTKYINYVAGWVLCMQLLDVYVMVLPALHPTGFSLKYILLDISSFVGIGGILGWLFLKNIVKSNLFPTRDPRLIGSIKLSN